MHDTIGKEAREAIKDIDEAALIKKHKNKQSCLQLSSQHICLPVLSHIYTYFAMCVRVWVKGEGNWGARLSGQTGAQVLRNRQDPQAVRKSPSAVCATPPPKGRGERYGGGGGGGEQHRASLALAVTRPVVSWVAVVSRQTGLAMRPLGIVGAVTLTRLIVTVASE